jgi:hypothetical protein
MQERAASEEPRRDVARIRHAEQIPCVAPRSDVDNHPSAAPAAADTEAQNDAPPIKRGRGRPRKVSRTQAIILGNGALSQGQYSKLFKI